MTDTLPELVTAHSVAKRLGIPLVMALEIPTDALMAMSRYIERTTRELGEQSEDGYCAEDMGTSWSRERAAPPSKKVAP